MGQKFLVGLGVLLITLVLVLGTYFIYLLVVAGDETRLGVLTGVVSVIGVIYTQNRNTKREIESRQFSQKAKIYEDIIDTVSGIFKQSKGWAEPIPEDDLAQKLFDIQTQLLVWAGPDVLLAWQEIKTMDGAPERGFQVCDDLFRALRAELGHRNDDKLGHLGLMKIYVLHKDHEQLSKF